MRESDKHMAAKQVWQLVGENAQEGKYAPTVVVRAYNCYQAARRRRQRVGPGRTSEGWDSRGAAPAAVRYVIYIFYVL